MPMTEELIDGRKAGAVLALLNSTTQGPREAYAVLCTTIWMLNFQFTDDPVHIDQLCNEVEQSLRSIAPRKNHHDA